MLFLGKHGTSNHISFWLKRHVWQMPEFTLTLPVATQTEQTRNLIETRKQVGLSLPVLGKPQHTGTFSSLWSLQEGLGPCSRPWEGRVGYGGAASPPPTLPTWTQCSDLHIKDLKSHGLPCTIPKCPFLGWLSRAGTCGTLD